MSATRQRLFGNGMAAGRVVEELVTKSPGLYDIVIFGAEPRVNYDRILLSPVLSGEKAYEDIIIHDDGWYDRHGITLFKGRAVTAVERARKVVVSADGRETPYDKLLIATGSSPFVLPVPGAERPGVLTLSLVHS